MHLSGSERNSGDHAEVSCMSAGKDVNRVILNKELHTCRACGYDRGFPTSLVRIHAGHPPARVILICPECGAHYDVRWIIDLT